MSETERRVRRVVAFAVRCVCLAALVVWWGRCAVVGYSRWAAENRAAMGCYIP